MEQWWADIDWAATGAWMQAWAGFLAAFVVIYAARKGAATFGSWLRQKQTERRMAVAEQALDVAYRLRRAFKGIRSIGYGPEEGQKARAKLTESYAGFADLEDDQQGRLTWGQVILTRIVNHAADWERLHSSTPLVKAHFGDEVEAALEELWRQQAIVRTAAQMYGGSREIAADLRQRFEADLWDEAGDILGGGDRVGAAISAAMAVLDGNLLHILRSEVTAYTSRLKN